MASFPDSPLTPTKIKKGTRERAYTLNASTLPRLPPSLTSLPHLPPSPPFLTSITPSLLPSLTHLPHSPPSPPPSPPSPPLLTSLTYLPHSPSSLHLPAQTAILIQLSQTSASEKVRKRRCSNIDGLILSICSKSMKLV